MVMILEKKNIRERFDDAIWTVEKELILVILSSYFLCTTLTPIHWDRM